MSDLLDEETVLALTRHILTYLGGWLVSQGWIGGNDMTALIGAGIAITGVIWSVLHKRKTSKVIDTALAMPPGTTRAELKEVVAAGVAPPAP